MYMCMYVRVCVIQQRRVAEYHGAAVMRRWRRWSCGDRNKLASHAHRSVHSSCSDSSESSLRSSTCRLPREPSLHDHSDSPKHRLLIYTSRNNIYQPRSEGCIVFSTVRLSVCVSVCQHDNSRTVTDIITKFRASSYGRKGGQIRVWLNSSARLVI